MKTRYVIISCAGATAIAAAVVGAVVYGASAQEGQPLKEITIKQASNLKIGYKCIPKDVSLDPQVSDTDDRVLAAIGHIRDVPAGTQVDVRFRDVASDHASGSIIYAGNYGSYNFKITKLSNVFEPTGYGGWNVTAFDRCQH